MVNVRLTTCLRSSTIYIQAEPHKYIDRKQPEDLSKLSIPVDNAVTKKFNPRSSDQHFLMNDPNNDGYVSNASTKRSMHRRIILSFAHVRTDTLLWQPKTLFAVQPPMAQVLGTTRMLQRNSR